VLNLGYGFGVSGLDSMHRRAKCSRATIRGPVVDQALGHRALEFWQEGLDVLSDQGLGLQAIDDQQGLHRVVNILQ
jgi:hypothetical protein